MRCGEGAVHCLNSLGKGFLAVSTIAMENPPSLLVFYKYKLHEKEVHGTQ